MSDEHTSNYLAVDNPDTARSPLARATRSPLITVIQRKGLTTLFNGIQGTKPVSRGGAEDAMGREVIREDPFHDAIVE